MTKNCKYSHHNEQRDFLEKDHIRTGVGRSHKNREIQKERLKRGGGGVKDYPHSVNGPPKAQAEARQRRKAKAGEKEQEKVRSLQVQLVLTAAPPIQVSPASTTPRSMRRKRLQATRALVRMTAQSKTSARRVVTATKMAGGKPGPTILDSGKKMASGIIMATVKIGTIDTGRVYVFNNWFSASGTVYLLPVTRHAQEGRARCP